MRMLRDLHQAKLEITPLHQFCIVANHGFRRLATLHTFGDSWPRTEQLDTPPRSLISVAIAAACQTEPLSGHTDPRREGPTTRRGSQRLQQSAQVMALAGEETGCGAPGPAARAVRDRARIAMPLAAAESSPDQRAG